MEIIKANNVVYEYIRRDEEGNVEGITRAVNDVSLDIEQGQFIAISDITVPASLLWQSI